MWRRLGSRELSTWRICKIRGLGLADQPHLGLASAWDPYHHFSGSNDLLSGIRTSFPVCLSHSTRTISKSKAGHVFCDLKLPWFVAVYGLQCHLWAWSTRPFIVRLRPIRLPLVIHGFLSAWPLWALLPSCFPLPRGALVRVVATPQLPFPLHLEDSFPSSSSSVFLDSSCHSLEIHILVSILLKNLMLQQHVGHITIEKELKINHKVSMCGFR